MKREQISVAFIVLITISLFSINSFAEGTGGAPDIKKLDEGAVDESVGRDVEGKQWQGKSNTTGQAIDGFELSCEAGQGKIGMCGGCSGNNNSKTGEDAGMQVSKDFAKVLNNSIAKCVAKACGIEENGQVDGAQVFGCGFQDRKTAAGSISNHASANAIDLTKIKCPGGQEIQFDLTGGKGNPNAKAGNLANNKSKSLGGAVKKNPAPQSGKVGGNASIPACSHTPPSDGYNKFNECWSEVMEKACTDGNGGALTAANTEATGRTKPDTKRCHHNDHVHFSSCPGKGL